MRVESSRRSVLIRLAFYLLQGAIKKIFVTIFLGRGVPHSLVGHCLAVSLILDEHIDWIIVASKFVFPLCFTCPVSQCLAVFLSLKEPLMELSLKLTLGTLFLTYFCVSILSCPPQRGSDYHSFGNNNLDIRIFSNNRKVIDECILDMYNEVLTSNTLYIN